MIILLNLKAFLIHSFTLQPIFIPCFLLTTINYFIANASPANSAISINLFLSIIYLGKYYTTTFASIPFYIIDSLM